MIIQGSINQLLTLSAAGLRNLPSIKAHAEKRAEISKLEKENEEIEKLHSKELATEEHIERQYNIQKRLSELKPSEEQYQREAEAYNLAFGQGDATKREVNKEQTAIMKEFDLTSEQDPYAKYSSTYKADVAAARDLAVEQLRLRRSRQGGKL